MQWMAYLRTHWPPIQSHGWALWYKNETRWRSFGVMKRCMVGFYLAAAFSFVLALADIYELTMLMTAAMLFGGAKVLFKLSLYYAFNGIVMTTADRLLQLFGGRKQEENISESFNSVICRLEQESAQHGQFEDGWRDERVQSW